MKQLFVRDERELAVDRAGDRLAYLVLSYGLLAVVAYRSLAERQVSWDLLALVVIGGVAGTAYRLWHRAFTRETALVAGLTILVAAVVGALLVLGVGS